MTIQQRTLVSPNARAAMLHRMQLRTCNAAVPIPAGRHKTPRSMVKQQIREENR